jgi:hypothetical protein
VWEDTTGKLEGKNIEERNSRVETEEETGN